MGFADDLGEKVKNSYYFFEDKWYATLDKIDSKIPVYKVIDPIDNIIPSFILFSLFFILIIIITGYFIQFSATYEVTFTTIDSTTNTPISGANILITTLNSTQSGQTDTDGKLKLEVTSPTKNIYKIIEEMLLGNREVDLALDVIANATDYVEFAQTLNLGSEHTIKLSPIVNTFFSADNYSSNTKVRLFDSLTNSIIFDNTNSAYIKFNCENKSIEPKKVYSSSGIFELNENECYFKIIEAYSPNYILLSNNILLPPNIEIHTISLNKNITTGSAEIWVFENGENNKPIAGAEVIINEKSTTTNNSGFAKIEELPEGEHEVFVTKNGFHPILSNSNETIIIESKKPTEKIISMLPMDSMLIRKVHLKIIDSDNQNPISGTNVVLRSLNNLNVPGSIIRTNNADRNGVFIYEELSLNYENKIVAILEKDGYIIEFLKPQLFDLNSGPQIVELKRANQTNSGFSKINVKTKTGNITKNLQNATVQMIIKNFNSINELPIATKITNIDGNVNFSDLPINYDYLAKATYDQASQVSNESKKLDANKTIEFNLTLNADMSKIIIDLKNQQNQTIENANIKLYQANEDFSNLEFKESFQFINDNFHSNFHSKQNNYRITIDANNYISEIIDIDYKRNPLANGNNNFNIILLKGLVGDNSNGEQIDPDNNKDGNVLIIWKDIYNLDDTLWNDDSTIYTIYDNNTYRAQVDIIIQKDGFDYNTLLGMIRTEKAIIENIKITPMRELETTSLASCDNNINGLDQATTRPETYYIREDLQNCSNENKILAGAKWSEKNINQNYLPKGTYSIAIDFTVDDQNEIKFYFRAKEERKEDYSETLLKEKIIPVGIPFKKGIFLQTKINNKNIIFSDEKKGSIRISENQENELKIIIKNSSNQTISGAKITAYSHIGPTNTFNEQNNNFLGNVYFADSSVEKKKIIGNNIQLQNNSEILFETNFSVNSRNSTNYLVIVFDYGGNKEKYFINVNTIGKQIGVQNAKFVAGIENNIFGGTIFPINQGNPIIENVDIAVYNSNRILIYNTSNILIKNNKKSFEVEIPGNYVSGDYLILKINSKEQDTDEMYQTFEKIYHAGSHSTTDPSLTCVDLYKINHNEKNLIMDWGENTQLDIINKCEKEIILFVETALICKYLNQQNCDRQVRVNKDESIKINITGKNKSYDDNINAPNFTDTLGYFPINVKARFNDKDLFSNASYFSINLKNERQCFEYVGWPILDFTNSNQQEIIVNNYCNYREINDLFIPTIDLKAFGYDVKPNQNFDENSIEFNISVGLDLDFFNDDFSESNNNVDVNIGTYIIPRIGGVNFIISSIYDLEADAIFISNDFIAKLNPQLNNIRVNTDDVFVWVENGYLFAKYNRESPYIFQENQIKGNMIKNIGSSNTYGLITVTDYVRRNQNSNRIISGDAS